MPIFRFSIATATLGREVRNVPHSENSRMRMHRMTLYRWDRVWKNEAIWASKKSLREVLAYGVVDFSTKADVTITVLSIKRFDDDNLGPCVKPILDGLKGILIADDSPDHITLTVNQARVHKRDHERVEVEVNVRESVVRMDGAA